MSTQIKKIGNSRGVIIPAGILKVLGLGEQDHLLIKIEDNNIVLTKQQTFNPQSLDELFVDFHGTYSSEIVFDDAVGREIW